MKHIFTLALFAAPFLVSAQEQPAAKSTNTPPTTQKSISDKGVAATPKSRAVAPKKATQTESPAPREVEVAPAPATNTASANEKPKE